MDNNIGLSNLITLISGVPTSSKIKLGVDFHTVIMVGIYTLGVHKLSL